MRMKCNKVKRTVCGQVSDFSTKVSRGPEKGFWTVSRYGMLESAQGFRIFLKDSALTESREKKVKEKEQVEGREEGMRKFCAAGVPILYSHTCPFFVF